MCGNFSPVYIISSPVGRLYLSLDRHIVSLLFDKSGWTRPDPNGLLTNPPLPLSIPRA